VTRYIDLNRGSYGVEPICTELQIAPSSYYAARSRPPSARSVNDTMLKDVIIRVHRANFGVYGARKVWKALYRLGLDAGRDQVSRLMKAVALQGVTREKTIRTTRPDDQAARPADLVERSFTASAPNRLWLADLAYVWTEAGFAYTAFITDAFSRRIVGWRTSASLRTDLALDVLEMALAFRGKELPGLVHHSDRGVQYLAIRCSLHRAPRRGKGRQQRREQGRQLRRSRRVGQRPLQGRTDPPAETLANARRARTRNRGVGPLVQHRADPRHLRRHPSGRVRGGLLSPIRRGACRLIPIPPVSA
jgi:hypothetical protein